MPELYSEDKFAGNKHRGKLLTEIYKLIEDKRNKADVIRSNNFNPDFSCLEKYSDSLKPYRQKFTDMLGWPLCEYSAQMETPEANIEYAGKDSLGSIYRLNITVLPGLTAYGILFIPNKSGPHPLIIAQHGGQGTPELCSGFFGSGNYNDMVRRVLKRGFAVFAPQLILWKNEMGPEYDRAQIDCQLKQLGGSIAAIEIFKLRRSLDYMISRDDIDCERIGMIGLSYGGFYTLFTTACDLRIKVALSSCFVNNRFIYDWKDWTWFNSGNTFLDAEVCAMICPRPLYIEVGDKDELFDAKYAVKEYDKVRKTYGRLGVSDNLRFKVFDGVHELDKDDAGIEFLCKNAGGI